VGDVVPRHAGVPEGLVSGDVDGMGTEEPLPRGSEVLVFNCRGTRSVDVMQFGSEPDPLI